MITLVPSPFELWAQDNGYDIAPAVLPAANRTYADRDTQAVFEAWNAGAQTADTSEFAPETKALRKKLRTSKCKHSGGLYQILAPDGVTRFMGKTFLSIWYAKVSRSHGLYGGGLKALGFTENDFPIVEIVKKSD